MSARRDETEFGAYVRTLMPQKGIRTQRALAELLDWSESQLSQVLGGRGSRRPTIESIDEIVKALGCEPEERAEMLRLAERLDPAVEADMFKRPKLARAVHCLRGLPDEEIDRLVGQAGPEGPTRRGRRPGTRRGVRG